MKPELVATGPDQVYSWDITKLHGPAKWAYFHLYVILDIYSRCAVGWMVATRESAVLAERLIAETAPSRESPAGSSACTPTAAPR
jgi:putative transposase